MAHWCLGQEIETGDCFKDGVDESVLLLKARLTIGADVLGDFWCMVS